MQPNLDVFLLFFNAVLSVALVAGVVVAILRREHLPVIRAWRLPSRRNPALVL